MCNSYEEWVSSKLFFNAKECVGYWLVTLVPLVGDVENIVFLAAMWYVNQIKRKEKNNL